MSCWLRPAHTDCRRPAEQVEGRRCRGRWGDGCRQQQRQHGLQEGIVHAEVHGGISLVDGLQGPRHGYGNSRVPNFAAAVAGGAACPAKIRCYGASAPACRCHPLAQGRWAEPRRRFKAFGAARASRGPTTFAARTPRATFRQLRRTLQSVPDRASQSVGCAAAAGPLRAGGSCWLLGHDDRRS